MCLHLPSALTLSLLSDGCLYRDPVDLVYFAVVLNVSFSGWVPSTSKNVQLTVQTSNMPEHLSDGTKSETIQMVMIATHPVVTYDSWIKEIKYFWELNVYGIVIFFILICPVWLWWSFSCTATYCTAHSVWYVSSKEDNSHSLEGYQRSLFLQMV